MNDRYAAPLNRLCEEQQRRGDLLSYREHHKIASLRSQRHDCVMPSRLKTDAISSAFVPLDQIITYIAALNPILLFDMWERSDERIRNLFTGLRDWHSDPLLPVFKHGVVQRGQHRTILVAAIKNGITV